MAAAAPLPDSDDARPRGGRSWRPIVVVAGALAALLLLAVVADGRLLVADGDPNAVTDADVRLARSLFSDVVPPEALAEACLTADGGVEPGCLDDGELGGEVGGGDAGTPEVVPRACRDEGSVDAGCLEEELGIDLPAGCTRDDGRADVGCLAGSGEPVVLTDRCLTDDGGIRLECLQGRVYGVPDPGPEEGDVPGVDRPPVEQGGREVGIPDDDDRPRPEPDDEEEDDALSRLLTRVVQALLVVGLGVLVVVAVVLLLRRGRPRQGPVEPGPGDEAHDRAVMAASIAAGARQLGPTGDARAAIIAAYAMLLEGLAACAQERHPAETPLEHLERVLAALDVQPEPLRQLTTLFGEARFSDHAMTERHVDRARAALETAAADLDRVREAVG